MAPSRRAASRSTSAPTSGRSAACSTRCSPAGPRSRGETSRTRSPRSSSASPSWRASRRRHPPPVRRCCERCLAKDPKRRLHDVADGRIEIDDALAIPLATPRVGVAASQGRSRRAWLLLGLVSATVVAVVLLLAIELVAPWRRIDPPPAYHQVTFRRGSVSGARFAPDGQTILYSAAWESAPMGLFSMRIDSPEFTSMPLPSADLLSVSASAKMAIRLRDGRNTLAEVTVAGRAPRELLNDVEDADWGPREDALAIAHVVGGRARLEYPVGTVPLRSRTRTLDYLSACVAERRDRGICGYEAGTRGSSDRYRRSTRANEDSERALGRHLRTGMGASRRRGLVLGARARSAFGWAHSACGHNVRPASCGGTHARPADHPAGLARWQCTCSNTTIGRRT